MAPYGYDSLLRGGEASRLPRRSPMGMDPNYRGGGYRGQRWYDREHQAAYGRYRAQHDADLGWFGGARGRHAGAGLLRDPGPTLPSGPEGPPRAWPEKRQRLNRGRGYARWARGAEGGYEREYTPRAAGSARAPRQRTRYDRDPPGRFDAPPEFRSERGARRYGGGYLGSGF
jgi:hypothetical protein